jgi:autotransporter adhesin
VALGGPGSAVRIGDIDASTLAQVGPVDVVTVDANGTLGRRQAASAASVADMRVSMSSLAAITDAQFGALEDRVLGLDQRVAGLEFRLEDVDRRASGGIAAAMALGGQMVVPDSDLSVSLNASTFRGEQGFAGSIAARLGERLYLSAGIAGSSAPESTGGRVGLAVGF